MGNPAAELHEILSEWRAATGGTVQGRRGVDARVWSEGFSKHIRAMALIGEIDSALAELESSGRHTDLFRSTMPTLAASVLALTAGSWNGNSQAAAEVPFEMLQVLAQLADTLEHRGNARLDPAAIESLNGLLTEILSAADDDESLDPLLANHIRTVVRHLQTCVDEYDLYGESTTMSAWTSVWVAMQAAAHQSTSHRPRWEAFKDRFFWPTAAGLLANTPSLVLQVQQITQTSGG
ncbi:hypothetical protein OEB99_16600 [Actinotalea sp. M2MS4P-6]|uniref:hypothetical protein n=1 Tax=Actinotalea sp. M2MS4P-6 TaxID=2983762 RepID=UPI0021E3D1A9|nr:hypothetical protein [Actinotalea sp. M2MS4P-6]MCV2395937.1 hypothetical protein [Actinotalea sp. M2MS4P-6]